MTGQTLSQKVISLHTNNKKVYPGEIIDADVDIALINDVTGPLAIREFEKYNTELSDKIQLVMVNDHFVPNKDIKSAEQSKIMREFASKHNIKYFFDAGRMGIEHILLPEQGMVMPYDLVIGADSHTCTYGGIGAFSTGVGSTDLAGVMMSGKVWLKVPEAINFVFDGKLQKYVGGKDLILHTIGDIGVDGANYKSMEFTGDTINNLDISDRLTMANMAIEAGAKNGMFEYDNKTTKYIGNTKKTFQPNSRFDEFKKRTYSDWFPWGDRILRADKDAEYTKTIKYNASEIEPQVAFPDLPSNVKPISEVEANSINVDQVVVGACTNGKIEDLRAFAKVFKGYNVDDNVRLIVIPGTQYIWNQGAKEGIAQMVVDAGGVYSTPTCGPCLGGHMGILAAEEKCLSTTNRNFVGRMGHPKSEVYLANPAIAAATAIKGYICSPRVLKK